MPSICHRSCRQRAQRRCAAELSEPWRERHQWALSEASYHSVNRSEMHFLTWQTLDELEMMGTALHSGTPQFANNKAIQWLMMRTSTPSVGQSSGRVAADILCDIMYVNDKHKITMHPIIINSSSSSSSLPFLRERVAINYICLLALNCSMNTEVQSTHNLKPQPHPSANNITLTIDAGINESPTLELFKMVAAISAFPSPTAVKHFVFAAFTTGRERCFGAASESQ